MYERLCQWMSLTKSRGPSGLQAPLSVRSLAYHLHYPSHMLKLPKVPSNAGATPYSGLVHWCRIDARDMSVGRTS